MAVPLPPNQDSFKVLALEKLGSATAELVETIEGKQWLAQFSKAPESQSGAMEDELDQLLNLAFHFRQQIPGVANEFFAFFWDRFPEGIVRGDFPPLRRLIETGDLAASALKDFLADDQGFQFKGRHAFDAWLLQRLKWKAHNKRRNMLAGKRREDLHRSIEDVDFADSQTTPDSAAAQAEQQRAMREIIGKLRPRDRIILRMYSEGASREDMEAELGMTKDALRQALHRALSRLRGEVDPGQEKGKDSTGDGGPQLGG